MAMRVTLELVGRNDRAIIRALKAVLKAVLRIYRVRCKSITEG